jgi:hypothetical protein
VAYARSCAPLAATLFAAGAWAAAPVITPIWSFAGNMASPETLISDGGILYGTQSGGANGIGAVFQLTPPKQAGEAWSETVLYNFDQAVDGGGFSSRLTIGGNGALYGTTNSPDGGGPCGTVYQLAPPAAQNGVWTHTVLYQFASTPGVLSCPSPAGVTFHNGALYGTVSGGGAYTYGMVFQLAPPTGNGGAWTLTILYTYGSTGVMFPSLPPIFDAAGNIYGVDYGHVYELMPPGSTGGSWTETVLHTFTGGDDGIGAVSLAFGPDNNLYGSTGLGGIGNCDGDPGCGVAFKMSPPAEGGSPWNFSTLYSFTGGTDGQTPTVLAFGANGAVYGSSYLGEGPPSDGLLFELAPEDGDWSFSIAKQYQGSVPSACVNATGGSLIVGLNDIYNGNIVELSPPASGAGSWTQTPVFDLGLYGDGASPAASLAFGSEGNMYGTTSTGGAAGPCPVNGGYPGCGTVFELTPPGTAGQGWTETVLYRFSGGDDGAAPESGVAIGRDGVLYGTASHGGPLHKGVVFRLAPPAEPGGPWTESVIHSFGGAGEGVFPTGPLVFDASGALYGTTTYGGATSPPTVFKLTPPVAPGQAWTVSAVYSFAGDANGPYPIGITFHDGALYGVASGSPRGAGAVFRLTPPESGTGAWTATVLHSFHGDSNGHSDGASPYGSLIFDDSGAIYGTTAEGGGESRQCRAGCGIVFQLTPPATQGGAWTENVLFNFSADLGHKGSNPTGVVLNNGNLYGTTCSGQLFLLAPPATAGGAWQEKSLANFTAQQGVCPQGLVLHDGALYGAAEVGGRLGNIDSDGTIYSVTP